MQQELFDTDITFYLLLNIIFVGLTVIYVYIIASMLRYMIKKNTDVFQYKLTNLTLSITLSLSYVLLFFVALYCLRMYTLKEITDFKPLIYTIIQYYKSFIRLPLFLKISVFSTGLSMCIMGILSLAYFHRFYLRHLFMLHVYCRGKYKLYKDFCMRRMSIGNQDIFSFYITLKCMEYFKRYNNDWKKVPKYNPYRICYKVIIYSPILLIVQDCILNNYEVKYLSYYMLIYMPIMLIRRYTKFLNIEDFLLTDLFYEIYYDVPKKQCIYAIPNNLKGILDMYLHSMFTSTTNNKFELDTDVTFYFRAYSYFELCDEKHNSFINNNSVTLQFIDNKAYEELEDESGNTYLGKEWTILAKKK